MNGNKEPGNKNDTQGEANGFGWGIEVSEPMEVGAVDWNTLYSLGDDETQGTAEEAESDFSRGREGLDAWNERVMRPSSEEFWTARRKESLAAEKGDIGEMPRMDEAAWVAEDFFEQRFPGMDTDSRILREALAVRALEARIAEQLQKAVARGKSVEELSGTIVKDELLREKRILEEMYVDDPQLMMEATSHGAKLSENEEIAWALASEAGVPGQWNLMLVREKYPRREGEKPDDYIQRLKNYSRQDLNREKQLRLDKESGEDVEDNRRRNERMKWKRDFLADNPGWGKPQGIEKKQLGENGYFERYAPAEREGKIKNVLGKLRTKLGFKRAVGKVVLALGQKLSKLGGAMMGEVEDERLGDEMPEMPDSEVASAEVEIAEPEEAVEVAEVAEPVEAEKPVEVAKPMSMQAEQAVQGEADRGDDNPIVMQMKPQWGGAAVASEVVTDDDDSAGGEAKVETEAPSSQEVEEKSSERGGVKDEILNEYAAASVARKLEIVSAAIESTKKRLARMQNELLSVSAFDVAKREALQTQKTKFEGMWKALENQAGVLRATLDVEQKAKSEEAVEVPTAEAETAVQPEAAQPEAGRNETEKSQDDHLRWAASGGGLYDYDDDDNRALGLGDRRSW